MMDRPEQEKTGTAVLERPEGAKAAATKQDNNGHKNGSTGMAMVPLMS